MLTKVNEPVMKIPFRVTMINNQALIEHFFLDIDKDNRLLVNKILLM